MKSVCLRKSLVSKIGGAVSAAAVSLTLATNTFAQLASSSAGKGGTDSSLPSAGSTELTYLIFIFGSVLFVVGSLRLLLSYRD